jgi:hypothetical protein
MFSAVNKLLQLIPTPARYWVEGALCILLIAAVFLAFSRVSSCNYRRARAEYDKKEATLKGEREKLIAQIERRDKEIAELELQKQAFKTMAEQGVRLDQEKAKQIDEISAKEAKDLEDSQAPVDCRTRAERTVALLLTAKPPIRLDLAAVIRKQCGPG